MYYIPSVSAVYGLSVPQSSTYGGRWLVVLPVRRNADIEPLSTYLAKAA